MTVQELTRLFVETAIEAWVGEPIPFQAQDAPWLAICKAAGGATRDCYAAARAGYSLIGVARARDTGLGSSWKKHARELLADRIPV